MAMMCNSLHLLLDVDRTVTLADFDGRGDSDSLDSLIWLYSMLATFPWSARPSTSADALLHLTRTVLAKFTPSERRLLIREVAGAFQTRSQQAVWDDQVTPNCPWCGQEDTKYHRYFSCTATQPIRDKFSTLC